MPWFFPCRRNFRLAAFFAIGTASALTGETADLRCAVLGVSSPQSGQAGQAGEARQSPRRARQYSATEILDLEIHVLLPGTVEGEHRLDVKVYTPDHHLYQVLTVPFRPVEDDASTTATGSRPRRRKLTDHPRPITETDAIRVREGRRRYTKVSATLPVAGTSIVASSLYGKWTATAFIDGSTRSCAPGARFFITE